MTEVPEHLLRRAKERRSAMTGEAAPEAGAPATDASKAVEPAASATPAPAGGGGGAAVPPAPPVPPPYTGPPPAPPRKQRVPAWAMPVLVALPLWAVLYGGAFGEREVEETGLMATGAEVYRSAGCSGCHGATGGGGVGPSFDGVLETFPDFADHVEWIRTGSAPFRGQPYGATGKIATGGMPGNESLTDEEVIAVVCHERITLGGGEMTPECEEGATTDGGGSTDAGGGDSASGGH